jgi:hypothetical protein
MMPACGAASGDASAPSHSMPCCKHHCHNASPNRTLRTCCLWQQAQLVAVAVALVAPVATWALAHMAARTPWRGCRPACTTSVWHRAPFCLHGLLMLWSGCQSCRQPVSRASCAAHAWGRLLRQQCRWPPPRPSRVVSMTRKRRGCASASTTSMLAACTTVRREAAAARQGGTSQLHSRQWCAGSAGTDAPQIHMAARTQHASLAHTYHHCKQLRLLGPD